MFRFLDLSVFVADVAKASSSRRSKWSASYL